MSFFGSGSGGFGQQNTQPTSGFGGFGSTTNTTNTGFGASGGGFGSTTNTTTPSTGLFGASSGTGFGASTSGFGSGSAFGAKPATSAFGTPATTTAGTGLFGGSSTAAPAATGFGSGGFGSTATNTASTGFGTAGGLFGSGAKPATAGFGTTPSTGFGSTTGGSLFGGGAATTTPAFGATNNPGIGTNITDPPGTAVTPFTAITEKEGTTGITNTYQNILFQDAYKKWSSEELRLADYNQGRKSGGMGGTGAFGSSGFGTATGGFGTNTATTGGFGSTGGGMFGNTGTTTGGFGTTTTATPAFGSTATTGGLFGAKPAAPATGGLFGSTTPAQPAATGGLFGSGSTPAFGSTTTNAFGSGTTAATGGGLFGGASAAAKPASGLFGNTGTSTTTGGLFGGTSTATPSAFGTAANTATATGGGLFGSTPAATTTGGGLFGAQTQQPAAGTGFGTGTAFGGAAQTTGGGLFGNAAKPAGAFGTTPAATTGTTGGLFGGVASTASPFGGAAAAQPAATGGLFGAKPATTGGGLFGGSTTAQPATGGLFGNATATAAQAQPATGGLFGSSTAAKPGGLFGSSQPATGGLFGSTTTPAAGGAFGASVAQPQAGGLGTSLFGASQGQQQPQAFSTSINDISAYGASTLFTNLTDDKTANPGPLATPLSGKAKTRSRSILPMYKLSPANASRFNTPRKQGYGFTYSTYGSPSSPSSAASTPGGLGQSLLVGGSIGRSGLSKSISASNLRRSFNVEDSILAPGAFSSSTGPRLLGSSNTHKKLVINRDLRADLFNTPAKESPAQEANGKHKLSKRVSFETTPAEASQDTIRESIEGGSATPGEDLGYLKPTSSLKSAIRSTNNGVNGSQPPSVTATPEMQQVKGNELAIVHEEASPEQTRSSAKPGSSIEPGSYWMSPSLEQIRAMNRVQRSKVDFTVGRENVGSIQFKVPVDLNNVDFENIFDEIVVLVPRSATVYPVAAKKPVVGKGLNVPARISLEHSYPRGGIATSERKLLRHVERLKASPDTTFEDYDKETGVWTFSVEHFTTYGLDDSDDEDDMTDAEPITSQLPASSATKHSLDSPSVDPDDTFEFKRSKRAVPGAFDEDAMTDEELLDTAPPQGMSSPEIDDVEVPVQPQDWYDDHSMEDEQDVYQQDIVEQGSQDGSVEEGDDLTLGHFASNDALLPGGIMRARMRAVKKSTAPTRIEVAGGDDWTQILQASVRAPRTVDRVALRALNESGAVWDMQDRGSPAPKSQQQQQVTDGAGFQTSIDLMKSLFEKPKGHGEPVEVQPARGFVKWPYQKRDKVDAPENDVPPPRPTWGPNELFVATQNNETNILPVDGSEPGSEITKKQLSQLQQFIDIVSNSKDASSESIHPNFCELAQEDPVWELASLLFDDNGANLAGFWKQMVSDATDAALLRATTPEEKAIICLAGHRVADACSHLMEARDFRLAGLVASIGSGPKQAKDIRAQLSDWRDSNVLSEFSEPIRAIYELLGGNACVCAGVKNVPIENRVSSFTISDRFGLDWLQAFGLRLFYTSSISGEDANAGWGSGVAEEAVRSFAADIEQDREPEPDHPLWSLLKSFAFRQFDWSDPRLSWLLTKGIYATGKISFGVDSDEKLDTSTLKFAASLTSLAAGSPSSSEHKNLWVQAAFVLGVLSNSSSRESAVREHLGRHAHLIGNPRDPRSPFAAMLKFGVPEAWIWEAKALHFRSKEDSRQEFLALVWAGNYKEANRAFVERVAPGLVIQKDFDKLFKFAELLFKVGKGKLEWEQGGANVYLLYPLAIANLNGNGNGKGGVGLLGDDEKLVAQLLDGLVALRAKSHGDVRQEAAIADMAESLIKGSGVVLHAAGGSDQKLYGLLPEDVRGKYLRARALETVC